MARVVLFYAGPNNVLTIFVFPSESIENMKEACCANLRCHVVLLPR